ncbi:MAG: (Fe-S)-binding protein, partial [Chloroflexota bacterium]
MTRISQIIADTRAYSCLDCGKCTVACPISRYDSSYSPRKLVYRALCDHGDEVLKDGQLWSCITCSMCEERCQSGVHYAELMRLLRSEAYALGNSGQCTHGGALQSLMRIMTADNLSQNRLDWLDESLKTAAESDIAYFVGCQPYFDVLFRDIGARTLKTGRGAIRLLNQMDIVPAVLPNERCCGHDLLWAGDIEHFVKLAQHNMEEIGKAKAKRVVVTCPECY